MQNHDQIGNRAKGERSARLMSVGRLKIAAALVVTAPFVPLLFQGEEWGASTPFLYFSDHAEPEIAAAVRDGRRREFAAFGWSPDEIPDPQDPDSFLQSKLNWPELRDEPHQELLDWHRRLIRLRRETPDLVDGDLDKTHVVCYPGAQSLVMTRGGVSIAFSLSPDAHNVPLGPDGSHSIVLASDTGVKLTSDSLHLPPDSVAILRTVR